MLRLAAMSTRLLVLGVVRLFQPVHGYEVRRELVTWRASEWASVNPGSIYNALKTLTRDGLLEVVGTGQIGGRPERTTYQLTVAGEEEFRSLLRSQWWTVGNLTDPLMAAVSFLSAVSRKEAIAALEHRITHIQGLARQAELVIESHDGAESPHHVREMMRLMNARSLAEIGWAQQFLERLRNGEYHTADDPPWVPASAHKHEAAKRGKRLAFRAEQDAARRSSATPKPPAGSARMQPARAAQRASSPEARRTSTPSAKRARGTAPPGRAGTAATEPPVRASKRAPTPAVARRPRRAAPRVARRSS
jgi:DNA-binding PadR family transcriptional regulator